MARRKPRSYPQAVPLADDKVVARILIRTRVPDDPERAMKACWVYQGYINHGYGQIWWRGRGSFLVHRIMATRKHGPIPEGMDVHHVCGCSQCCNPEHLLPVKPSLNRAYHNGNGKESPHNEVSKPPISLGDVPF